MDDFGTVRKKQPNSQILKILTLRLGLGIIVDFLSGISLTTKHVEKHMQLPYTDQYVL